MFRLLLPCVVTAGSILVDNLIRDPHAETTDEDIRLIQNLKQVFALDNSLLDVFNEIERIAHHVLRRIAQPPMLSQIPEHRQPFFSQSSTPQQWTLPFGVTDDQYVARPISSYDPSFSLPQPLPGAAFSEQTSLPISQPYSMSPQYTYPFQHTDPAVSSSIGNAQGPIIPPNTMQAHHEQASESRWSRPNRSPTLPQPTMQSPSQQQYSWTGSTGPWETRHQSPQQPGQSPQRPHRGRHKKQQSSTRGSHQ